MSANEITLYILLLGVFITVVVGIVRAHRFGKYWDYVVKHHKLPSGVSLTDYERRQLITLKNQQIWLSENPGCTLEDAPDHIQLGVVRRDKNYIDTSSSDSDGWSSDCSDDSD